MPDEIFFIVITAIIFGTMMIASIFKSVFKYAVAAKAPPQKADSSLTTSELHGLIRDAVTEATAPLHERIDAVEQRLERPQQLPPARSDLLAETEGYLTEVPDAPRRQPVR